jgi:membrane glycosyltransferase
VVNTAIILSVAGALSVLLGWTVYFSKVYRNATPRRPVGTLILEVGGSICAGVGLSLAVAEGGWPGLAVLAPATFALIMGPFFPAILSQRKTPVGKLQVAEGDEMLAFKALTSTGRSFSSEELQGRRVLFKFFRGGW